jgi:hypothetical protein
MSLSFSPQVRRKEDEGLRYDKWGVRRPGWWNSATASPRDDKMSAEGSLARGKRQSPPGSSGGLY